MRTNSIISSGVIVWLTVMAVMAFGSGTASATEGVRFDLSIYQHDIAADSNVLLYNDLVDVVKGVAATGYLVSMAIDIQVNQIDTSAATFDVHVYTLAEEPNNYAQRFRAEWGLPARLDKLIGKAGSEYALVIKPIEAIDIDTTYCGWVTHNVNDFKADPSANVNIHYVPNTLGDYYWNSIKGVFNDEYETFLNLTKFNLPGRYELYLCPCRVSSVIWDNRFSMVSDPIRRNLYAIYSREFNSAYPFLILHASLLRNYGYAPPFLSEGLAGYLSFANYDMKKLLANGVKVSLDDLLDTYTYMTSDPTVSDRVAATFVKYLVDQYQIDEFLKVYRKADDLTIRQALEEVYGKSVAQLDKEWRTYVDTVKITFAQAMKYREEAETLRYYDQALEYSEEMLRVASSHNDTVGALSFIVRGCFFVGDYYRAIDWQKKELECDTTNAGNWMGLAAYEMMTGQYDSATEHLDKARTLDSSSQFIMFNQAINKLLVGDTLGARQLFSYIVNHASGTQAVLESHIFLGFILKASDDENDHRQAFDLFSKVISSMSLEMPHAQTNAQRPVWLGIAYLGIDDTGNAYEALKVADFLETRPFYQGLIQLWMGKVADVRGEHDVAREHYGKVLAGNSAFYHQEEARRYIETPYTQ